MLKIIIVEDELYLQKDLLALLTSIDGIEVIRTIGSVKEALEVLPDTIADVVLLDIHLGDGTAFDLIRQIPSPLYNIIFITAYEQYAINAIKAGALDYLLKPVDFEELKTALSKVKKDYPKQKRLEVLLESSHNNVDKIVLKNTEGVHFIKFEELIYCRGEGSYTHFYTEDGLSIMVSKSLKEYEGLLPVSQFTKCHQSYTVNKLFIKKISRDGFLELKTGMLIPVSERRKEQVIKELSS